MFVDRGPQESCINIKWNHLHQIFIRIILITLSISGYIILIV
jgi:hypothetical protein